MAKGKLSGMQGSGMQRTTKRKKEEEQEQQKQQPKQEQPRPAAKQSKASELAASAQKTETGSKTKSTGSQQTWQRRAPMRYQRPDRSTVDALHETIGLTSEPEKLPNYIGNGQEPAKPEKLPYRPAESTATVKPLGYSPYAGFAGDVRQFTDSGSGTVKKPEAKPEEKKSGFASFSQDEEADAGVEEQPDEPKQTGAAPASTALDDYLSEQKALRQASDPERKALETAAAEAQAAFEKLDSQDKTWWGPMDWDSYNRAQAAAAQANKALADYKPFTDWDGRSALIDELNEIDNNSGFITNEAEANAAEARREEIIGQLTAGDEAAGNAPTTYTDNGRARDTFTGATNQYLSGAVNALGTAVRGMGELGENAGNASQYAGYATDEMSAAAIGNGTDEERQAWTDEMQRVQGFGDTVQQAADSLGEEAAKDLAQAKAGLGRLGQAGVDIATNVIQMGYDAGLGGLWAMFLRSAGASAQEARQDGATTGQQIAYGLTKGGIEVATEKLFDGVAGIFGKGAADDVVEGVIRKLTGSDTGRTILRAIAGAGGEGAEEVISDILSPFAEKIYKNESLRELFSGVNGSDVLYDFLIGAAIGGLGGGTSIATGQNAAKNAAAREADAVDARVNEQMDGVMDALANPNAGQENSAPPDPTQADEVVDALLGPMADAQAKADAAERVEEILTTPTAETAETPQETAELPGGIPAPHKAAESATAQSETLNSDAEARRQQLLNIYISNIKNAATRAGINLNAFFDATREMSASNLSDTDIQTVVQALTPVVEQLEANGDSHARSYLDAISRSQTATAPSQQNIDNAAGNPPTAAESSTAQPETLNSDAEARRQQLLNIFISNIKNAATRAGINLNAFFDATREMSASNLSDADIQTVVEALTPVVEQLEANGDTHARSYLDAISRSQTATAPSQQNIDNAAGNPPTAAESSTGDSRALNSETAPARATSTAKAAADSLAESVGIEDRGGRLAAGLQEIADYIQSNNNGNGINEEELRAKAEKLAADALDAIPGQETGDRELYDGIRSMLDGRGFEISDELRGDVADYNAWRKSLFGKLSLVKNGESIDTLYAELGTTFGKSLFPDDITSHADQINRIVDVLEGTRPQQTSFTDEVSQEDYDAALAELTQQVLDSADGIESTATALSDESLSSLEENAPPVTIGGTPVTPSTVQANGPTVERGFAENVRMSESTEEALAKSLGADKVTYERLLNKDVLATAQGIYDQGYESAKGYLDGVISAAKNGAKLPPEAVPLARMVANEMTRNGDVVGAERLIADVAAELTTAGQLGQVGKILRQSITTPEGKLYGMQKAVDKINEQADGKYTVELPQDLVEAYTSAESDEARDDIISQMQKAIAEQVPASWMEKWNALRYTAMLGNFKTQTRNIAGNLVSMVGRMAKDRVAAAMEYIGYLASGGQMERTKSVLYDPRLYAEARKDFANVQDEALGEGKYNDYQKQLGKEIEDKRRIFKSRVLEGWRRLTNWAMEQGDVIFSRANYADAMAGWLAAHNIKSLSDATPEQLDRARAYAIQQAQEATFRDSNDFSQTISGLGRNKADTKTGKVLQAVGEGIMPFRKTPANILVRAEEYSPLGVINTIADAVKAVQGKGGVTASDVIDQAAKSLTGSGIMLAGYLLAASGALRGKDRDKEQENFDKLRGEQDWSVTIGDTSYTLDWVSPYSIPLFMGAQLESLAAENGLSFGDVLNTFAAIGEPMLEMSMLDGLNDAFEVVQSYTDETPPIALLAMNSLASLLSQAAPTMLGQFERYGEDYRQSTYTDPNGVLPTSIQRKISQTMAKIPGYDYQQQDYIDAWGRKQETPQGAQKVWETFFSPYYSSTDRSTPVDDELQRLYDGGADKVFPDYASRNAGGDVGRLSPEEYETYATVKGQTSLALVQDFIESEEYKGLSDTERAEIIQNLYKLANNSAKTAVMRQREEDYGKSDPITALLDAGMDAGEAGSFVMAVSGGDGKINQSELKDYYGEHPEDEDVIAAIWDTMGFTGSKTATWEAYKASLKK